MAKTSAQPRTHKTFWRRLLRPLRTASADTATADAPLSHLSTYKTPEDLATALHRTSPVFPFWPQTPPFRLFYAACAATRARQTLLHNAAARHHSARRQALAFMRQYPQPAAEALLPRHTRLHLHLLAPASTSRPARCFVLARRHTEPQGALQPALCRLEITSWGGAAPQRSVLDAATAPSMALFHLVAENLVDILRTALREMRGGPLPAVLDASLTHAARHALPAAPDRSFAALRLAVQDDLHFDDAMRQRIPEMIDACVTVLEGLANAEPQPIFTCSDDTDILNRGWGARYHAHHMTLVVDEAMTAALETLSAGSGKTPASKNLFPPQGLSCDKAGSTTTSLRTLDAGDFIDTTAACTGDDALALMALFARAMSPQPSNRDLRDFWCRAEDAGLTARIGSQLGLILGDLQNSYEQLARADRFDASHPPDFTRLQDRVYARGMPQPDPHLPL